MAYSKNPHLAKVRMDAVRLVKWHSWSTRQVSRYTGFSQSAIVKWCQKDRDFGNRPIPTRESIPKNQPNSLYPAIVEAIVVKRKKLKRCAEVVHQALLRDGIVTSLSSVKRTLDRKGLTKKRSPWKRYHPPQERPLASNPGDLVQMDTIHFLEDGKRTYVYTLIDVFSRWAYAQATERISSGNSIAFLRKAQHKASLEFQCIQSDHGPEFSQHFTERIGINHRHSRVRKPNDNGHLERFNRTLQDECLRQCRVNAKAHNRALQKYLPYYNGQRLHMGINFKTPQEILQK
jgi:transposase InsO family protein